MSTLGFPISRRESLKRAAGALAVGLGAPAALAADGAAAAVTHPNWTIAFYAGRDARPIASMNLPQEVAEKILEEGSFSSMKIGDIAGEIWVGYDVRPRRR